MATSYFTFFTSNEDDLDIDFQLKPYMYEPQKKKKSDNSSDNSTDDESPSTSQQYVNCACGQCVHIPNEKPLCCHKYELMKSRLTERRTGAVYSCITEHPGFQSNCLDIYVLERSYYDYCYNDGEPGDDEPLHETLRYVAYRNLVRWIFKRLGSRVRKQLPACVVNCIRERYPSESGEYTGFKDPFQFPTF